MYKTVVREGVNKGQGIAIVDTTDYIMECERQLQNTQYYQKLDSDMSIETIELAHQITTEMYENKRIDLDTYKFLDLYNIKVRTPQWYL